MSESLAQKHYRAQRDLEAVSNRGQRPVKVKLNSQDTAQMAGSIGEPYVHLVIKRPASITKIPLSVFQALCLWGKETGLDTLDIHDL